MANIEGTGLNQDDLVTFLTLMNTQLTAVLTLLDSDTGVTLTTYVATYGITFPTTTISATGIRSQGDILTFLDTWRTNFIAMLTALDGDAGITAVNWASTGAITDVIDTTAAGNLYQTGMNQSQLVNYLQTCITAFAVFTAKADADGDIDTATYATNNITDTVINTGCND